MLKAFVGSLESRLVFFPEPGESHTPSTFGLPHHVVHLTSADGERLVGWQLEPARPLADVVYFHGNGGNLSLWLPVFVILHRLGYRVLAVDYRGYGLSTGSPTEQGVFRDAEATVRHAARDRTPGRPLVFWGRSLGTAVTRIEASGAARRFWVCSARPERRSRGRPEASPARATSEPKG